MSLPGASDRDLLEADEQAARRTDCRVRIVVLDDVSEVRESIRIIIQAGLADAEIVECENGNEAWKIIQESPTDLLISDLTHPGLRGEELSQRLADGHPNLPMLVISAVQRELGRMKERHQADSQSPRGFLAKPFTVEAVRAEVGRLVAGRTTGR